MRGAEEKTSAREQFSRQLRSMRRWRLLLLPLFVALLASLFAFLWFAFSGPVVAGKAPLPALSATPTVTLRVGGDIMLAGAMEQYIGAQGPDFPFRRVSEFFSAADCGYAFLETALADSGSPLPGKPLTLVADPSTVECLALSGLSLVGLASDHMLDYDAPALSQTTEQLLSAGIGYMGAGENIEEAAKPYTVALSPLGLRVALLNFCANAGVYYSYQYPRALAASLTQSGIADLEEEQVLADIVQARRNHDLVILNLHWGEELAYLPSAAQRELAHRLIDGGADVIIGSHSHCLQGVEVYNNGLIAYSLGNLVYAPSDTRQVREAALLELELTALGWQNARFYPVLLSTQGQPALATGRDASDILERLRSISSGFNAKLTVVDETLRVSQ